jgi:hypothetical protein
MTDQELLKLDVKSMKSEEARIVGMELLRGDIIEDKASVKRSGLISGLLTAGMLVAGMDTIPGYAIMGVDSMFLFDFFNKLQALHKKKKQLKQFETNTYPYDYRLFLKTCQNYVKDRENYLKNYNSQTRK